VVVVTDVVDLSRFDFSAIAEPTDKLAEADFFLDLARKEPDRLRFRWLISAYLNAAYSYFDTAALHACNAFSSEDGGTYADDQAVVVLGKYINIKQNTKNSFRVHTQGENDLVKVLYELRKNNTHYFPMAIMEGGPLLPDDYHFGHERGKGKPILKLCSDILELLHQVQRDLDDV
jgi:hypothetical protein